MKILILAGGSGTRLWPFSCTSRPKQFLHFGDGISLLQKTIDRFKRAGFEDLFIITQQEYVSLINHDKILIEPNSKNTGPALIYAVKVLLEKGLLKDGDLFLVTPSDHLFTDENPLVQAIQRATSWALSGNIVTFGIQPTHPETGFGYIKKNKKIDDMIYEVANFIEKPPYRTAKRFLKSGNYLWNSGIFLFETKHFLSQIKKHAPLFLTAPFNELPSLSIDYALLEKSDGMITIELPPIWSDIGSWDSVYKTLAKDAYQNVLLGNIIAQGTEESLIMGRKRLICALDMKNLLFLETENVIFISHLGNPQRIKDFVHDLKETHSHAIENPFSSCFCGGEKQILSENIEKIIILPGNAYSFTSKSDEAITILQGCGLYKELKIDPGSQWRVPKGTFYTIQNQGSINLAFLKALIDY